MSFTKTAATTALVAAVAFSGAMMTTAAHAHGKKHFFHLHHFHHRLHSPIIVIGTPIHGCKHWLNHYYATGKKVFLKKYYACKY
jgi:hypothetical protein